MKTPQLRPFTRLRRWMHRKKVTQSQLAFHCDVSLGFVHQLLQGKYADVSISFLDRLSKVTKIPAGTLMKDLLTMHRVATRRRDRWYREDL